MGFRTLEISRPADIHIKEGQMEITSSDGLVTVPVEDLNLVMLHGANIRLSSMDLSILSINKVAIITLDDKYLPTAIVLPFDGHARQSQMMHAQAAVSQEQYLDLWVQIIRQKISNQAKALSILGFEGAEDIAKYADGLNANNVDNYEALSARDYFSFYNEGLNRRGEDPMNSRLNYGYAVIRSYIARSLVVAGFHPAFGIHHDNQLNAFNLADDLIEPYRAMVDLAAQENIGSDVELSKQERRAMALVLHNACVIGGAKVNIMTAVDNMVESLKRIILDKSDEKLELPVILPLESLEKLHS